MPIVAGNNATVITQIQVWTADPDDDDADDDGWDETTNYYDSDVTSENYFDFTANNSFRDPSLAPPNKGGIYTMHIDSDTSSEVDSMTSDGTNTLTKTYWGQGKDSYNNVSMGFNLSDSWSMSEGELNQVNGSETGLPNYEGTSAAPGFIGEVLMDYGDYYAGFTGPAGNGSGLVTPNISSPGSNGTLAPPYNVPPEVIPSTNLGPEAQALRDQIYADVAAGQVPQDSGGMTSADYKYYLFNPSKMDSSLATASTAAWRSRHCRRRCGGNCGRHGD